jgi:hypothetical protein
LSHSAASPCLWPAGHAVRPATQALGVRSCQDCHRKDSPFFFGQVPVDSPVGSDQGRVVSMIEFQHLDSDWAQMFNRTFKYRVWLKRILLVVSSLFVVIVVSFACRAVIGIAQFLGKME